MNIILYTVAALAGLLAVWFLLQRVVAAGFCCLGVAAGCMAIVGAGMHWLLSVPFCILTFGFFRTGYADYRLMRAGEGYPDWRQRKRRIYRDMAIYSAIVTFVWGGGRLLYFSSQEPEGRAHPASAEVRKRTEPPRVVKAQPIPVARNKQLTQSARKEAPRAQNSKESTMNALAGWVLFFNMVFIPVIIIVGWRRKSRRRENLRKLVVELDGISRLTPEGDEGDPVRTHLTTVRGILRMMSLVIVFAASAASADWWNPNTWFSSDGEELEAPAVVTSGTVAWSRASVDGVVRNGASGVVVRLWIGLVSGDVVVFTSDDESVYSQWRGLAQVLTQGKQVRWNGNDISTLEVVGSSVDPMMLVPYNESLSLQKPEGSDIKQSLEFWLDNEFGTRNPLHAFAVFPVYYTPAGLPESQPVSVRVEVGPFSQSWVNSIMAQIWDDQMYHLVVSGPRSAPVSVINGAGMTSSSPGSSTIRMVYEKGNYVLRVPPERINFRAIIGREVDGFPSQPVVGKLGPGINTPSGYEVAMQKRDTDAAAASTHAKKQAVQGRLSKLIASARTEFDSLTAPVLEFQDDEKLQSLRRVLQKFRNLGAPDTTRAEEVIHHRVEELNAQLQAGAAAAEADMRRHEAERRQQQQLEQHSRDEVVNNLTTFNKLSAKKRLNKDEARSLEAAIDALQGSSHDDRPTKWPTRDEFEKARKKAHRFSR